MKSSTEETSHSLLFSLPKEIILAILKFLDLKTICCLMLVSREIKTVAEHDELWKESLLREFGDVLEIDKLKDKSKANNEELKKHIAQYSDAFFQPSDVSYRKVFLHYNNRCYWPVIMERKENEDLIKILHEKNLKANCSIDKLYDTCSEALGAISIKKMLNLEGRFYYCIGNIEVLAQNGRITCVLELNLPKQKAIELIKEKNYMKIFPRIISVQLANWDFYTGVNKQEDKKLLKVRFIDGQFVNNEKVTNTIINKM